MSNYTNYAGTEGFADSNAHAKTVFAPGKRRRINLLAVCLNIFFPVAIFTTLYCAMSFKFHYQNPILCWLMVFGFFSLGGVIALFAYHARKRDRDPMWLTYTAFSVFFAVITATIFGNMNYVFNLLPYYEIDSLNTYPSVNPANDWGQEMMDVGRIYFADGTKLDMKHSTSFKNTELYCVAPIVHGDQKLTHYDYWAVGQNCCSPVSADFRCGQFNNPKARSGLRLVADGQIPFYRLAVQMAEAQFQLAAPHPLFFTWVQDPVAELSGYLESGWKFYLLGVSCHFAFNLFGTISAMVVFSKIGYI